MNPLLENWDTPFNVPPFKAIKSEHFEPAVRITIEEARREINGITDSVEEPSFSNTIESLESSGRGLGRISAVLFNLNSAETTPELQKTAQEVSPLLTRFSNDITLNPRLFEKVRKVYESRASLNLSTEQERLVKDKYRDFINGGAGLDEEKKERFRMISEQLAKLALQFEENVLAETNHYQLHLTEAEDLSGLPEGIIEAAAAEAKKRKRKGWIFTLQFPSYVPFMQYADRRDLREKMFRAYSGRAFRGNKRDNRDIVRQIVNLRLEKARLLGRANYAEYALEESMAKSPEKVIRFLKELYGAARPYALQDRKEVQNFAASSGFSDKLERWDWAYFSEKLKMKKLNIDDELLRPYFRLDSAQAAIFSLATRLYGIRFHERTDIPVYNSEVRTFELTDESEKHLALLMVDFHPREGKSSGAWMTAYREQAVINGQDRRPVISIVMNFSRPTATRPALITHNELTTFLHEFGHALHGMMSRCTYETLSGTSVTRDFVELPSQLMENWAYEKEWLDSWATHYKTGSRIPAHLFAKIKKSLTFNEGYACNRQISFGMLDMAYHTLTDELKTDIPGFEREAMEPTELFDHIEGANMSCSFGHLFSGGYAAGYYGYKWAEVLDADAFSLFIQKGLTDRETAKSFRENILERGGTDEPMKLYKNFRGREPGMEALLKRSGFKK